jgi:carboxymethylenebutenolidase
MMTAMAGPRVALQTDDGVLDVYVSRPEGGGGPWPAVILFMDAFGVRAELAGMAERLASNGYVVALPNLYYRTAYEPFDQATVAAGGAERDRFKGMIASIDGSRVMADTGAILAMLDADGQVRRGPHAAVGYCMGGGYALRAAGAFPDRFGVAASFHGGSLATDTPDSPHRVAPRIRARVYVGVAEHDPTCPPDQQARLGRALTEAGVTHTIEVYPGTKHGFAVTGHHAFDAEGAARHWNRLLALLADAR